MPSKIFSKFIGLLIALTPAVCSAYTPSPEVKDLERPVIGFYNLELGSRKALSTYLSPFSYKGFDAALSGFWTKSLPANPEHLSMLFDCRLNFGRLLNPSKTALEYNVGMEFQWGVEWKKRLPGRFIIGAGGVVGFEGGVLYLPRNGNNPASALAAAGIGACGSAGWHFNIGKLPVLASDRVVFPLAGAFFCPAYGETYYEIYLGNRADLVHFGWFGNRFGIDNLLSFSLDFGKTAMQIGYRFSMQSEHANHLDTRIFNHAFVIGVIPGGLGLKRVKPNSITPLY